ncbi:hypothetical protein SAMN04490244_10175 [Tranquillimonas rosea]|uniref:Uncharacterized protein n=1 Tax=Tranquillimonas rosea TaxID=641238 RepID=A0A1H9P979_9RHOB|nr:hypothetical protein [Tranquillimonas rosea]SER44667.1 hypothetical protein SAMN04490244_10175 [Tranquillimonas rosea]
MQWSDVQNNWPAFVERVEQRWPNTNQADLLATDGDLVRFLDYLAKAHDLTAREAEEQVSAWLQGEIPTDVKMDEFRDNANIMESARHIPPGEDVYDEDSEFGDEEMPERPLGRDD